MTSLIQQLNEASKTSPGELYRIAVRSDKEFVLLDDTGPVLVIEYKKTKFDVRVPKYVDAKPEVHVLGENPDYSLADELRKRLMSNVASAQSTALAAK